VALILGLLVGAAVTVLFLFILYRVAGRNPYACLERRHGDEKSATPASVYFLNYTYLLYYVVFII